MRRLLLPFIQLIKLSLLEITWGFYSLYSHKNILSQTRPPPGYTMLPVACRGLVQNFAATPLKKRKV